MNKKQQPSMKRRSTLFMLLLVFILLLTLYFQNKTSNNNYLNQIEQNYKKSFDNHLVYFKKRLINYYESHSSYILSSKQNINTLISKERFLKDIEIVNIKQNKITSLYKEKLKEKKSFLDVLVKKDNIYFSVIVPILKNKELISYINYKVDSRVFLQSIKDFDGSNGIIYIKDKNRENDVFLKEYKNDKFFKSMASKCQEEHDKLFTKIDDRFYVKKNLTLTNLKGESSVNAIFFLDISKEKKEYISLVRSSIITSIILFILAAISVNYFFNYLIKKIEKNENKLKEINKNLEQLVEEETNKRLQTQKEAKIQKEKSDELLLQQSKLAMLGEMIGNIAHQWRQPLMQLSAILMYLDAYNEKGKLSQEKLTKKIGDGNSIIDFMSKTIEDFRNYYKPEKQKEEFYIKQSIDSALFIVNSSLRSFDIKVNIKYEDKDLKLISFKNEFSQALLNIITNAKDILIQRNIQNPYIDINVSKQNSIIKISVLDNAGGIKEDIANKIFDPYFTTKHKSQGTGIGLYMTKMIIENNMNGSIEFENTKLGAKFTISLNI